MDGSVGGQGKQQQQNQQQNQQNQQNQQQQQQARRKEWRAVTSPDGSTRERMFQGSSPSGGTSPRMNLAVRPRDPCRNGRVYHMEENPSSVAKEGMRIEKVVSFDLPPAEAEDEALQQRISEVSRQREQLQQVELELRARFFARSEILRLQSSFDEQVKQHNEIVASLQEQLQERDSQMQQMQQHLQEREQKLQMEANEALNQVWTKDALLREQSNEMTTLRRERENAVAEHKAETSQLEAERSDLLAQVNDLKGQLHEKERRLQKIEEQDIFFLNDKQLRDAQMWMARAQELEAYHVNAMNAEIRDRSEQMNQLWVNCQRQLTEMERYYNQLIQKLQQDLADSNHYRNSKELEGSSIRGPKLGESGMHQLKPGMMALNDTVGTIPLIVAPEGLAKVEHATGLPVLPTPMVPVMPPSNNIPNVQQYGTVHQQPGGATLQPFPQPVIVSQQPATKQGGNYQQSQVVQRPQRIQQSETKHLQSPPEQSPTQDHSSFKSETEQRTAEKEHGYPSQYLDQAPRQMEQSTTEILHNRPGVFNVVIERSRPQVAPKNGLGKENPNGHFQPQQPETSALPETQEVKNQGSPQAENDAPARSQGNDETGRPSALNEHSSTYHSPESNGKASEAQLSDRDTLLASLIRVIPAEPSAKIRIGSTLQNRLAKMLAPLHWHDYRKRYGRLDEFLGSQPQLFVVEGDFIHLREGAHAIVSASAAAAKASAAVSMPLGSTQSPTVALTPVAQPPPQRTRGSSVKDSTQVMEQQEKKRTAANGRSNYLAKNPGYKGQVASKENERSSVEVTNGYGNGVIDGYINFNQGVYFKNLPHHNGRSQEIGARPQTQEGRILEAAT